MFKMNRRTFAAASVSFTISVAAAAGTAFPGQLGKPVGYAAAPGYPGALTAAGSVTSNNTYSFRDFNGLTLSNASNVTFFGCRFKSNSVDFANIRLINCRNIKFDFCSVVPSKHAQPTHPSVWPSAGAGTSATGNSGYAPYMIPGNDGYQYGIRMEGSTGCTDIIVTHCDIWGFGNAIDFAGAAGGILVEDSWIHDAANPDAQGYHTDGPGYLDGGGGRKNIIINRCTIASLGNTNGIAFQAASSRYENITVSNCFLSGFGYCVDMCHNVSGNSGMVFTGNVFGTHVRWHWGPLYANFAGQFGESSNLWRGNKLWVMPGTSKAGSSSFDFTGADDGKFVLPDASLSTADFE
jgi:hypothetical protein